MIADALLLAAFGSVVLVIYWLTEKPKPKQPRSQYTLPTSSASEARRFERPLNNPGARVYPPEVIGEVPPGVGSSYKPPESLEQVLKRGKRD